MLNRPPVEPVQGTASQSKTESARLKASRATPVRIYTNAEELVSRPFRDLNKVSNDSYQASNRDSPPSIPTARKRMQVNASKMKANAVLLHSCEVISGTPGCYHQAVCIGPALNITTRRAAPSSSKQALFARPIKKNSPFRVSQVW